MIADGFGTAIQSYRTAKNRLAIFLVLLGGVAGPVVGMALVLGWHWWCRAPLSTVGLVAPRRWSSVLIVGIVAGVAFKLAMKALVMPLLGAAPQNDTYRFLTGNTAALPTLVLWVLVSAAFGEEVFYRGFLQGRLTAWLGSSPPARSAAVVLAAAVFAVAHLVDQGRPGATQAAITGLVFGAIVASGRGLSLAVVMHGAFDLTALALIYRGWEAPVATFFFP